MKHNELLIANSSKRRRGHHPVRTVGLRQGRQAFTMVELMTVMVIIGILTASLSLAVGKAREMGRRARAETELREMVAAWLQFHQLYEELPGLVKNKSFLPTTRSVLEPLINTESAENKRGLVLLNPKLPFNDQDVYVDPWGTPYQLSFTQSKEFKSTTAMQTSVSFTGRQRRFP